jgi:hypothetical protein
MELLFVFAPGSKTPFTINVQQLLAIGVHASVAAFHRCLRKCINERGMAEPMGSDTNLGMIFRQYASPHPIRAYDLPPLRLKGRVKYDPAFQSWRERPKQRDLLQAKHGDRRLIFDREHLEDRRVMQESLRQAVLNRVLGDVTAMEAWSAWGRKMGHSTCSFRERPSPSASEDEPFLEFLNGTAARTGNKSIARWVSGQHERQVPDALKTAPGFYEFWRGIQDGLIGFTNSIGADGKSGRKQYMSELRDLLDTHTPSLKRKSGNITRQCGFLAQQVVQDLEEVWRDPFGPIRAAEDVVFGPGSRDGASVLSSKTAKERAELLRAIHGSMTSDTLGEDYLASLGLVRDGDTVRVMDWGRPVGFPDGEHLCCKTSLVMRRVHSSRGSSRKPVFTKGHCHPVAVAEGTEPWDVEELTGIANAAVSAFDKLEVSLPASACHAFERKAAGDTVDLVGA